jgi:hypothetical protein
VYLRVLYHRAKIRAPKRGLTFNLTQEHLMELWARQGGCCYYSGLSMTTDGRARDPFGLSLDRVDSTQGYIQGNVVLCCWGVNTAKQEFTLEEFLTLCRGVAAHNPLSGGSAVQIQKEVRG